MSSFYSIVQYVPEPISGERANIGVVVLDGEGRLSCRFLRHWRRVQSFGGEDIGFLRDFAEEIERQAAGFLRLPDPERHRTLDEQLAVFARAWGQSIQFTAPRASLESRDALLDSIASRVLREPVPSQRHRDHRHAASLAVRAIEEAWEEEIGPEGAQLIRKKPAVPGEVTNHPFDVAIWNGKPLLAAQGMSFEIEDAAKLSLELNARAWSVADVHKKDSTLKLAVLVLPPLTKGARRVFDEARHVFSSLNAEVVSEKEAPEWAARSARAFKRAV